MPVRVKSGRPRRKRRDDLADLRGLGDDDAGKWRSHGAVVKLHLRALHAGLCELDLLLLRIDLCGLRIDQRPRDLDSLLRRRACVRTRSSARLRSRAWPGSELEVELHELRACRTQLRIRLRERGPLRSVFEQRQHLAEIDVLALLDHDLGQRTGDLRRHRRFATRGDVAGRLQHRHRARRRCSPVQPPSRPRPRTSCRHAETTTRPRPARRRRSARPAHRSRRVSPTRACASSLRSMRNCCSKSDFSTSHHSLARSRTIDFAIESPRTSALAQGGAITDVG